MAVDRLLPLKLYTLFPQNCNGVARLVLQLLLHCHSAIHASFLCSIQAMRPVLHLRQKSLNCSHCKQLQQAMAKEGNMQNEQGAGLEGVAKVVVALLELAPLLRRQLVPQLIRPVLQLVKQHLCGRLAGRHLSTLATL